MSIIATALKKAQDKRAENHVNKNAKSVFIKHLIPEAQAKTHFSLPKFNRDLFPTMSVVLITAVILAALTGLFIYLGLPRNGKNPVRSLSAKQSSAYARRNRLPILNGIMFSPVLSQAVINGTTVAEGENIAGFSILKIFPHKVKIASTRKEKKEFELTV